MQLSSGLLDGMAPFEIVEDLNKVPLTKKISIISSCSVLKTTGIDSFGKHYIMHLGKNIYAKVYKRDVFCNVYGWISEIRFYYIKSDLEKEQEYKINELFK